MFEVIFLVVLDLVGLGLGEEVMGFLEEVGVLIGDFIGLDFGDLIVVILVWNVISFLNVGKRGCIYKNKYLK